MNKAAMKLYNASVEGKAVRKRYRTSVEGKAAYKRYRMSPKGRTARKRYNVSPEGRVARKLWETSTEGVATHMRVCAKLYGLSLSQYEALTNRPCDICGKAKSPPSMHIDHDHATKKIRGTLCGNCNRGLGQFKDDLMRLTHRR